MGIDWCWISPKQGYDLVEIRQIMTAHSTNFKLYGGWAVENLQYLLPSRTEAERQLYKENFRAASYQLEFMVDFVLKNNLRVIHRVYFVTYNPIFPPEWRYAAYDSFLPDELPQQTSIWKRYINEVRLGAYRKYLFELYCYELYVALQMQWDYLQGAAENSIDRTNRWATKLNFIETQNEILKLSKPIPAKPPIWGQITANELLSPNV